MQLRQPSGAVRPLVDAHVYIGVEVGVTLQDILKTLPVLNY
jgi:hypothetical protein